LDIKETPQPVLIRPFRKARYGVDKFVLVQHYKIHYVEAGKGDPVIMIPGSFNTYRVWNRLMPLMSEEHRLLALDYVGVGDSDKPCKGFGYTLHEQTDVIAQMVQQLRLGKVSLIGGSYGGAIVFDFAARYPELTEKIVSLQGDIVKPDKASGDAVEYCLKIPILGELLIRIARLGVFNKPVAKVVIGDGYSSMNNEDKREVIEQIDTSSKLAARIPLYKINVARRTSRELEDEAKSIKSPILYLYGSQPHIKNISLEKNLEYLKKYLPHAWVVAIEGRIYELAIQNPGEIASLINEFFRKQPELQLE
jgi:pimeloyl-ACP methyl ester carboxylesterase